MDFSLVGLLVFAAITLTLGCFLLVHALWQLLSSLSWMPGTCPTKRESILRPVPAARSVNFRVTARARPRSLQEV